MPKLSEEDSPPVVKMPVLLQQQNDAAAAGGSVVGLLVAALVAGLVMLGINITLTVFAVKRNQKGTELYGWMCGFLVLLWCSQLLAPVSSHAAAIGGFTGFVGTCVMVHMGGKCGGGGCKPGQSGEEMLRSLAASVAGSVAGSSMTSF